jgi:hypothetical protein
MSSSALKGRKEISAPLLGARYFIDPKTQGVALAGIRRRFQRL